MCLHVLFCNARPLLASISPPLPRAFHGPSPWLSIVQPLHLTLSVPSRAFALFEIYVSSASYVVLLFFQLGRLHCHMGYQSGVDTVGSDLCCARDRFSSLEPKLFRRVCHVLPTPASSKVCAPLGFGSCRSRVFVCLEMATLYKRHS